VIIDVHGHVVAPPELYLYKEYLVGTKGAFGRGNSALGRAYTRQSEFPEEMIRPGVEEHLRQLDSVGTDIQLISARPYSLGHSEKPGRIVHWFTEATNNVIASQCAMFPNRLGGIVNLPQVYGEKVLTYLDELDRCVNELAGFVGVMVNPDPSEGLTNDVPGLGDEFWFPLYEKLVEYGLPMIVHATSCNMPREDLSLHFITEESRAVLSLAASDVFEVYPDLKVIIPHGGGCIPYQMGRFRGVYWENRPGTFDEQVKRMWFDTSLYGEGALPLLLQVMGPDNVVFGTERPGDGTHRRTSGGFWADDIKSKLESLPELSTDDRNKILEGNARSIFKRLSLDDSQSRQEG
jgi:4-oxalmesaconate hydratase